jgi:membrane associated rhomboid family serine protease
MMIFPISTDVHDGKIRLAALQIIALCVFVHFFVSRDNARVKAEIDTAVNHYYTSGEMWRDKQPPADLYDDPQRLLKEMALGHSPDTTSKAAIEEIVDKIRTTSLTNRFGFVPGHFSIISLFTHMFMHGDWLHLIGNMIFFYVCGVAMEKYWGYWRFLFVYLGCGVAAALSQLVLSMFAGPGAALIPMVGASGAIAGAMGAFVVTHSQVKVKIFYIIGFIKRGTFFMSSVKYFGFWFASQLVYMFLDLRAGHGGVAYGAHVGGFALGLLLGKLVQSEDDASVVSVGARAALRRTAVLPGSTDAPVIMNFSGANDAPPLAGSQVADAWETYRSGSHALAAQKLSQTLNNYLQTPEHRREYIAELITGILKYQTNLQIPPTQLYQWGKALSSLDPKKAVACHDMAARAAGASKNTHVFKNSLFAAAQLRISERMELDRAKNYLERVVALDGNGMLAQQASEALRGMVG